MNAVKIIFLLCFFALTQSISIYANPPLMEWEWQFEIKNQWGFYSEDISIYYYDTESKNYIPIGGGKSSATDLIDGSWNAIVNIENVSANDPRAICTIPEHNIYVVVIGNQFVRIEHSGSADESFYYTYGGSISTDGKYNITAQGTWDPKSIVLQNDFSGGSMYINSELISNIPISGAYVTREASTFPHTLTAIDNQTGRDSDSPYSATYGRKWKIWSSSTTSLSREVTLLNYSYLTTATFDKLCNVAFETGGHPFTANGSYYSSSSTINILQDRNVEAYAHNFYENGLNYSFSHWLKNGVPSSNSIQITDHTTIVPVYTRKPQAVQSISFPSAVGQPLQITWTDNPNPLVTSYTIYRKVKHNGIWGNLTSLGDVNAGVQSFTDYEYTKTYGTDKDLLQYDVRAHLAAGGGYTAEDADPNFVSVYGETNVLTLSDQIAISQVSLQIPNSYSVSNYPNPFNPTTVINYQLPAEGFVTIKVYDMLGKEVAELVNENKAAGYYRVSFDASKLASGIYIYSINAGSFNSSKKMILTK